MVGMSATPVHATLYAGCHVMSSCDVLLQLGEEVPLERVLGPDALRPHHLRMHQVRVLTGHHPRLLADQVCPASQLICKL